MSRKRRFNQFQTFGFPNDGTKHGNADRKATLELNKELRNLPDPLGHLPWGSTMLQIPELDYYVLTRRYPDLIATDAETQKRAWDKFFKSPEAAPYRIRATDGKRNVINPHQVQT